MSTGSLNGGIIGADNTPSPTKKITTFTSNGCFNRTVPTAQVVVVAGGGGGAYGGGGAGGVQVTGTDHPLPCSAVPVTVGAGGAAATGNGPLAGHGNNSVFASASDPITVKIVGSPCIPVPPPPLCFFPKKLDLSGNALITAPILSGLPCEPA